MTSSPPAPPGTNDQVSPIRSSRPTDSLVLGVVGARLVSATVNFLVNRSLVFHATRGSWRRQLASYAGLAVLLLLASYGALDLLTELGVPLLVAKPVADTVLFAVSWLVQQRQVFAPPRRRPAGRAGAGAAGEAASGAGSASQLRPLGRSAAPTPAARPT